MQLSFFPIAELLLKTRPFGLLSQRWAERRRRLPVICPAKLRNERPWQARCATLSFHRQIKIHDVASYQEGLLLSALRGIGRVNCKLIHKG